MKAIVTRAVLQYFQVKTDLSFKNLIEEDW